MSQDIIHNRVADSSSPAGPVDAPIAVGIDQFAPVSSVESIQMKRMAKQQIESSKVTPQILLLLIIAGVKRSWKWALPTGLVLGSIAFATFWFLFPKMYEAKAWMQILANRPYVVYGEKEQLQYDAFVNTQFALIRSPLILEKALENQEVSRLPSVAREKDPMTWLVKKLQLQTQGKSEMITVAIETEDPNESEKIVNAIVTAFFDLYESQSENWNSTLIRQLTLELNRQQAAARILQKEIRDNLEQAANKGGGGSSGGKDAISAGFAPGESILREVYLNESRLDAMKAELTMIRESVSEAPNRIPDTIVQNAVISDPELNALQSRLRFLSDQVALLKQTLPRQDDPKITNYQAQIDQINKQLKDRGESVRDEKKANIERALTSGLEEKLWEKEMAVRSQEILLATLRQRYNEQIKDVTTATTKIADVSFQQSQLSRINSVLDLLSNRIVSLQTEMHAPQQIQLRKKAVAPTEPKTAKRLPLATLGGLVFLCLPLFLGIAMERVKPRLYHVSQVRNAMPEVIIGEIMEPPVSWVQGANFHKKLARYRESVHNWCTHLLLSDPFRKCHTLSIASVAGDDGKTFLAVQVAVAMAQMKSGPVLLIDGDMRVGRLHLLFGNEESGEGLADVLAFRKGLGEVVVLNEKEPNLHLLSAGNLDVTPYELLGDGRFRELLDMLEQHYSLILIVLPPVANAAESLIMAASTDSTLLCVRQGETILAAMEDVYRKLVNTGASVDGIVVKDIPYYQMAGKDGGFADKLEQIRLAHLLKYAD
ncbi:MAG: polysaccharide biosynthesis tyrosine autokinase [Thermoguttaceae bacterium]